MTRKKLTEYGSNAYNPEKQCAGQEPLFCRCGQTEQAKASAWSRVAKATVEHPRDSDHDCTWVLFFVRKILSGKGTEVTEEPTQGDGMEERRIDNTETAQRIAVRVSLVSVIGNILLTVFKLLAGIIAHSTAMVSDAVHSASDVVSSLIVIAGVKVAGKKPDKAHPYGHERFENVAAFILSAILAVVGGTIGIQAVRSIILKEYLTQAVPGMLTLIAAIVSIVGKGLMFLYTRVHANAIRSTALKAEAWHHLSDALSSIGALIGIGGAMLGVAVLEPIASVLICLMILKAAVDIFREAMDQMVDKACSKETEEKIRDCILKQEGVLGIDLLHTRQFGNRVYVDTEIAVDGSLSLVKAHAIAERVHLALEQEFSQIKHVMVHVNPSKEQRPD